MPLGRTADDPRFARWTHGLQYGFVGAGGGAKYRRFLPRVEPGMRVFAYVAGAGYVGIGEVPCRLMQQRTIDVVEAAFGLTTPTITVIIWIRGRHRGRTARDSLRDRVAPGTCQAPHPEVGAVEPM